MNYREYDKLRDELYKIKCFCQERDIPVPFQVIKLISLIEIYRCDVLSCKYYEAYNDNKKIINYLYGISTIDTML